LFFDASHLLAIHLDKLRDSLKFLLFHTGPLGRWTRSCVIKPSMRVSRHPEGLAR
jgi:hypothetical protein